ncbi:MAG TPA: hypothetical protein VGR14_11995 [Verrucomicrobiae bacterium]|jgi:hypothetical protein|nr:hypothetical protein [Verrucomicrobiae bacterium]
MKKRIPTVTAALVFLCFLIGLSPGLLRTPSLIWVNRDHLFGRHGFYFKQRQWLADLRTIVAAFRFLYTTHPSSQTNPVSKLDDQQLRPHGTELSTTILSMDATASPLLLAGKSLSRGERRMAKYRWSAFDRLPPMLAFAEISSNGASGPPFYRFDAAPLFPEAGTSSNSRLLPRARKMQPRMLGSRPDLIVSTNLQGV